MGFNPLEEKGMPLEKQFTNWSKLNVKPFNKNDIHPYSRCRIILMCGAEFEGNWFSHQFARHTADLEIKRKLAMTRRIEQLPKEVPELTIFKPNIDYVRKIIAEQADLTGDGTDYTEMDKLPKDHRFWKHQDIVNEGGTPSETVIRDHIEEKSGEYRQEIEGPHPLEKYRA